MTSKIGDIIQAGESIPYDVVGVLDCDGDDLVLNARGHWHHPSSADPATCGGTYQCGIDPTEYTPLTVTAVREPEPAAEPQPTSHTVRVTMGLNIEHRDGRAVFSTFEGEIGSCEAQTFLDSVAEEFGVVIRSATEATSVPLDGDRIIALARQQQAELDEARAEVERLKAELAAEEAGRREDWTEHLTAARPDPLVLSLPEVPEGAVALVGKSTRVRYMREVTSPVTWRIQGHRDALTLLEVFQDSGPELEVEMAPPCEPRRMKDNIDELRNWINLAAEQKHWEYDEAIYCLDRIEEALAPDVEPDGAE